MVVYKCSKCSKVWTKLVDNGCVFCGVPCEVLPKSMAIVDAWAASSGYSDMNRETTFDRKMAQNELFPSHVDSTRKRNKNENENEDLGETSDVVSPSKMLASVRNNITNMSTYHSPQADLSDCQNPNPIRNNGNCQTGIQIARTNMNEPESDVPVQTHHALQKGKKKKNKKRGSQKQVVHTSPKQIAQLELPDPIPPPTLPARSNWNQVSKGRRTNTNKVIEDPLRERRQVNASSYLAAGNNHKCEGPRPPVDVRIGLSAKHDIRMMLPRSAIEP